MIEQMKRDILSWIEEAGELVKARMQEGLSVQHKTSLSDLVTNVDQEIEGLFKDFIAQNYPSHQVLGEEGVGEQASKESGYVWIIDPIDGTMNFVKEKANFSIMIALYINGVGALAFINDVMAGKIYHAQKGRGAYCNGQKLDPVADLPLNQSILSISSYIFIQNKLDCRSALVEALTLRMIGSASQSSLRVFTNKYNGYISLRVHPWDYMAPLVFADELGLVYSTLKGEKLPLFHASSFLLASPRAHQEILSHLKAANPQVYKHL